MTSTDKDTSTSEAALDIEKLCRLQNGRIQSLSKAFTNFKKDSDQRKTKAYFELRHQKANALYCSFQTTHDIIMCMESAADSPYVQGGIADKFEELYIETKCAYTDASDNLHPVNVTTNNQNVDAPVQTLKPAAVQLPRLPVPSFSGKFVEWPAFHDAFDRLIHSNTDLDAIQKFHFLKQALPKGSDADIHQMPLVESNYNAAWKMVLRRYNNPRLLFMHHMHSLFKLPALTKEKSDDIKTLLNVANVCMNEFNRLKIPISSCDHWIAYFIATKLPKETHQAWEHHLGCEVNIPTFAKLEAFLHTRLITIDVIENRNGSDEKSSSQKSFSKQELRSGNNKKAFATTADSKSDHQCQLCGGSHILRRCPTFLLKNSFERKTIVEQAKLCFNCLSNTHTAARCQSTRNCMQCGQRHHSLLHFSYQTTTTHNSPTQINKPVTQPSLSPVAPTFSPTKKLGENQLSPHSSQVSSNTLTNKRSPNVLLATAIVSVVNTLTGETVSLRALIDQGSECTIISEHAIQTLKLQRKFATTEISGVGQGSVNLSKCSVAFGVRSHFDPKILVTVDHAYVLKSVTSNLPTKSFRPAAWPHIEGLILADPQYNQSRRIDLLLGADTISQIVLPDIRIGRDDEPIAQNTRFGWVLLGKTASPNSHIAIRCHHATCQLENMVQRLYEEDQVAQNSDLSEEDEWCENYFKATHVRQPNGRYQVRLPLKNRFDANVTLGKSKQIALNRFYALERKLDRNVDLKQRYAAGIAEYFSLSQITPARTTEDEHITVTSTNVPTVTSCVLPHQAVVKEDHLTTKLRIVFDASCKTSNGRSLNDLLCIGPALQNDLAAVLLNWRKHEFVFTADIQRMYRCIDMHPEDSQYQRILWRNDFHAVQEYCLTTVTFGTASAPYTAIRVLHQLADDEKSSYPLAEPVLKREIYVDDILSGSFSVTSALEIRNQVTAALQSAGMELRKWSSNSPDILRDIPIDHTVTGKLVYMPETSIVKMLGVCWQPERDMFKFKWNCEPTNLVTKRHILSTTARFYDPLGLISPVIIKAKILFKEACTLRVQETATKCQPYGWDTELPSDLSKRWYMFIDSLQHIESIQISRWLHHSPHTITSAQLHTFCDGSTSAYAACVYLRLTCADDSVHISLLYSKARVTPSSKLTTPRIELQGAVLAVQVANWASRSLNLPNISITRFFWTDATIVLYWIRGDPGRLKIWVANRVNKILASSKADQWNHVDTAVNPADCASRGLSPRTLSKFQLWWGGPEWLRSSPTHWPQFDDNHVQFDPADNEEQTTDLRVHFVTAEDSLLYKYSSYNKLIRVCAYIFRFVNNCHTGNEHHRSQGPLSAYEYQQSLQKIVRLVQREAFGNEISCLRRNQPVSSKSRLKNLSPYLDNEVIRVRGRIEHSLLTFSRKHPMILPNDHFFTKLAIDHAHYFTLHGGAQLTLTYLRNHFWIVNGRRTVQKHIRKCVICFRQHPRPATQLMGDLPLHRVTPPQRAFMATGVDYTGAIELKAARLRGSTTYKGYIAIFICLATKAIHLEAVTGLSTEHFLMALKRFLGRRGVCKDIYSDCGTNFQGAARVLQSTNSGFTNSVRNETVPQLAAKNIEWHFNPPYSPNFGGLWESNVKSVKHHLKRIVGDSKLTFEELSTVLVGIEACLNSRPLCPLNADTDDLFVLTPGHFLIGDALLAPAEMSATSVPLSEKFLHLQRMVKHFWQRWTHDWLAHLQTRPKWFNTQDNVRLNDLVIVKEDRVPTNEWVLGRITDVHPGPDNLVRVVTVRTAKGSYKRSIAKICPLPLTRHTECQIVNV